MKTTRNLTIMAIAAMLIACGSQKKADQHKCVAPMPAAVSIDSLKNCMVPASFNSATDFNWMGGLLTMNVYNEDLYDAVEVTQLQVGDTLVYDGAPIVIEKIDETANGMEINGGQVDQGGCLLVPYEGGTYIGRGMDDYATYTELGKAQVPLAENFIIVDCGENPTDPNDTIRADQKLYLETLSQGRAQFSCLNTLVTIENGAITAISRRWTP